MGMQNGCIALENNLSVSCKEKQTTSIFATVPHKRDETISPREDLRKNIHLCVKAKEKKETDQMAANRQQTFAVHSTTNCSTFTQQNIVL